MLRAAHWLLVIGLVAAATQAGTAYTPGGMKAQILGERVTLDEDTAFALRIHRAGNSIHLAWRPIPDALEYFVVRAFDPNLADAETLFTTTDTSWIDNNTLLQSNASAFYWLYARYPVDPPNDEDIVENFDFDPVFTSYGTQDAEPDSFHLLPGGPRYPNGEFLELYGNTWKRETIPPFPIHNGSIWRLAVQIILDGEHQAFGMADSANEMWYSLNGWEQRISEAWIQTYQGWLPDSVWYWLDLAVGDDWYSHFGYYPNITSLMYANDNDADTSHGIWQIDEIRDITGAISFPPEAGFTWEIIGYPTADSMDVLFRPYSFDPETDLAYVHWNFGDSTFSFAEEPVHRYRSNHSFAVVLTVADSAGQMDWAVRTVTDTTSISSREVSAIFTGDVMIARRYESEGLIETWGVDTIFGRVQPMLSAADFAMCNLECPLTSDTNHHPTKLFYFKGRPEYVEGLDFAGFDFVSLANNHSFDYMLGGQQETIHVLDSVGILNGGAGDNETEAREPIFYSQNGVCIAIVSFCNRDGTEDNAQPYLAAGPSRPGFAMWDRAAIEAIIPTVDAIADLVIVQVHSGIEYALEPPALGMGQDMTGWDDEYPILELLPDTSDVSLRRYALDMGADIIINHHPHVIQGVEIYNGKIIAHSMGNFAFDQTFTETMLSFALEARLSAVSGIDNFVVHPIYIDRYIPTPASGELARALIGYEAELCRPMGTWLVNDPNGETGYILMDTNVTRTSVEFVDTLTLSDFDPFAVSAPFKLEGGGSVTSVTIETPEGVELRVGRDVLLFGNMEAEGARAWDLNSNFEHYDPFSYRGARSIRLNRAGIPSNSVSTRLFRRPPYNLGRDYSISGWVFGDNTRDGQLIFEYWNARAGGDIQGSFIIGQVWEGSFPWTFVWQDLVAPEDGWYYNVVLYLRAPQDGEGQMWFDDIYVVQWEDWETGAALRAFPNNLTHLQVRAPLGTTAVIVDYQREWVSAE